MTIKSSRLNNPCGLKFLQYTIFISEDAVHMQSLRYQTLFSFDINLISVHFYQANETNKENFWITDSIDVAFVDIILEIIMNHINGFNISKKEYCTLDTKYPVPCTLRYRIFILLFYIAYNFSLL